VPWINCVPYLNCSKSLLLQCYLISTYIFFYQRNARGGTRWSSVDEETNSNTVTLQTLEYLRHIARTEWPHVEECNNLYEVQI